MREYSGDEFLGRFGKEFIYASVDEEKELDTMPDLNEGEHLNLDDVGCEQKFTKPPARYNDATLVKALEENGIGRPSTYASIISVIAKREYTEKQQKSIVPTQLGEAVCEYMAVKPLNLTLLPLTTKPSFSSPLSPRICTLIVLYCAGVICEAIKRSYTSL